jgi:tRNA nucleotidyltransferase (CCA-adding enzyme)
MNDYEINKYIPEEAMYIINELEKNGFKSFLVGGCIRDILLRKLLNYDVFPHDFDIATNALPEDVMNIFEKTVPIGIKHGTVIVIMKNKSFEVTTFRLEGRYSDFRHPDSVNFTNNIIEDLARRDITINAMAYNPRYGLIYRMTLENGEYADCISDLRNKIIRCVGCPDKRFNEDALRMMRVIRFACQLGFEIETDTWESLKKNYKLIEHISIERINQELVKMLLSDNPDRLKLLIESKMLEIIIPELYSEDDVCRKLNDSIGLLNEMKASDKLYLKLSAFFKPFAYGSFSVDKILKRLRFDNKTITDVSNTIKFSSFDIPEKIIDLKKLLFALDNYHIEDYILVKNAENLYFKLNNESKIFQIKKMYDEICRSKQCYSMKELEFSGKDAQKLGFKGEEIAKVLKILLDDVMEHPELNNYQCLQKIAVKNLGKVYSK